MITMIWSILVYWYIILFILFTANAADNKALHRNTPLHQPTILLSKWLHCVMQDRKMLARQQLHLGGEHTTACWTTLTRWRCWGCNNVHTEQLTEAQVHMDINALDVAEETDWFFSTANHYLWCLHALKIQTGVNVLLMMLDKSKYNLWLCLKVDRQVIK